MCALQAAEPHPPGSEGRSGPSLAAAGGQVRGCGGSERLGATAAASSLSTSGGRGRTPLRKTSRCPGGGEKGGRGKCLLCPGPVFSRIWSKMVIVAVGMLAPKVEISEMTAPG